MQWKNSKTNLNGDTMNKYRKILEQKKGQKEQIITYLDSLDEKLEALNKKQKKLDKAQAIIQVVAQLTQEQLKYHISELVTLALAAVFDDPYEFEVDFIQRRNQTECDLWFVKEGQRINPLTASGGGAVDVACFALRVSLYTLKKTRCRPIFLLDEPLRFLKGGDLPEKGAMMMKEISERLGLQIIYISHIPEQVENADVVYNVSIKNGVSNVREVN